MEGRLETIWRKCQEPFEKMNYTSNIYDILD